MRRAIPWLVSLVVVMMGQPVGAAAPTPTDEAVKLEAVDPEPPSGLGFSLFAVEEYRFRHFSDTAPLLPLVSPLKSDSEADHDLRFLLGASLWENRDRFSAEAVMGLWADADGVASGAPSGVGSAYDLAAPYIWFDVYSLWGQFRSRTPLKQLRIGRQTAEHGPLLNFDGIAADFRVVDRYFDLFVYGGRTKHYFELDADLFEDWTAAVGGVIRPVHGFEIEFEYRFALEDVATAEGVIDHEYGLQLKYRHEELLLLSAYYRGINDHAGHAGLGVMLELSKLEFGADLRVDTQLTELGEIVESGDAYHTILGNSLPHIRTRLDVWKAFSTSVGTYALHLGWAARMLFEDAPETKFNRDYGRLYLLFQANDIGVKGLFASLVAEWHYSSLKWQLDPDGLFTVGGSVGYDAKIVRAEVGSHYASFKYTYFKDAREIQDVRTVFADVRVRPVSWLDIRLRYEYEAYAAETHTFMFTLAQRY